MTPYAGKDAALHWTNPGEGSCRYGGDKGYVTGRRISMTFDEATFFVLREMAVKKHTSFAEQVRIAVAAGLSRRAGA